MLWTAEINDIHPNPLTRACGTSQPCGLAMAMVGPDVKRQSKGGQGVSGLTSTQVLWMSVPESVQQIHPASATGS